jgi:hypothetical protein
MKALFIRLAPAPGFVLAALALSTAAPASAQPQAAAPAAAADAQPAPPAKHKPHRRKVPNFEMDIDGSGDAADRAGVTTSTDNSLTTSGLSGSTGASASFVEFPTPELPQPPSTVPEQAPLVAGPPRN